MAISSIFQILVPKDNKFIGLFEKGAANLMKAAELLKELTAAPEDISRRNSITATIKEHEKCGDDITHTIFNELNKTFITPFDRDDIQGLASSVDDVLDGINDSCQKIMLYNPKVLSPEFAKMAEYIFESSEEISNAVMDLKNIKNSGKIKEACININTIENHADELYHNYLSYLFEKETNAVELIKKKEIMQILEKTVDMSENVSDVIKSIIVKNS